MTNVIWIKTALFRSYTLGKVGGIIPRDGILFLGLPRDKGPVKRSDIDKKKISVFISNVKNGWNEPAIFAKGIFDVEPVDFNVLYCLNMKILGRLFAEIGDVDNASKYT